MSTRGFLLSELSDRRGARRLWCMRARWELEHDTGGSVHGWSVLEITEEWNATWRCWIEVDVTCWGLWRTKAEARQARRGARAAVAVAKGLHL